MRHEAYLMDRSESLKVVASIDAWCRRTGTNYRKLIVAAGVGASTRSGVKHHGRRLSIATAEKIIAAMQAYPHGISRDDHKVRVRNDDRRRLQRQRERIVREYPAPRVVDRSPCPRCGTRKDIGCAHFPNFEHESARG